VQVGGTAISPGAAGFASGAPRTALPAGIIAVLVLLGIAGLAAATPLVRRHAASLPRLASLPKRVLGR
jgi:hypothetical protein